jgi:hypothetical protein
LNWGRELGSKILRIFIDSEGTPCKSDALFFRR